MSRLTLLAALLVVSPFMAVPAMAEQRKPSAGPLAGVGWQQPVVISPYQACRMAVRLAEERAAIPHQLMAAIARVESGRPDGQGGISPWPWSINVEGADHVYASKEEAITAVRAYQARGISSIDVGCMQINLLAHPNAFASLDAAFDPMTNASYAARFLTTLFRQTGTWVRATAYYHSATPERGEAYQKRVAAVWPDELRYTHEIVPMAAAFSQFANRGFDIGLPPPAVMLRTRAVPANMTFMLARKSDLARAQPLPAGALGLSLNATPAQRLAAGP